MEEKYKKIISTLKKLFTSWDEKWKPNQLDEKGQNILSEIQKNYEIPREITYLYLGLKDDQDTIRNQDFTFFNLKTINKNSAGMREDGQMDYVDIAMSYAGMGHFWVFSWHKEERKYFMRLDGGSNGYEANDNYERYVRNKIDWNTLRIKKINMNEEEKDLLMEWEDLIYLLGSKKVDSLCYELNIGNYL
jgi:hypothetical protein